MITALRVRNLAIVESAEVNFDKRFNVITGETGAGKSLLVDALHLILGGRASTDLIRTGESEALVEAIFEDVPLDSDMEEMGIEPEDDHTLIIRRTIQRQGKGRVWINGTPSTVGQLERIARSLVDISGQHEHVSLLRPELHMSLLDAFADDAELLRAHRQAFAALEAKKRERDELALDDATRENRMDYLRFQLDEMDAVDPKPGELETLEARRRSLDSVEKQRRSLEEVDAILYSGDGCVADRLATAEMALKSIAQFSTEAAEWLAQITAARIDLNETARDMASHLEELSEDPEELERVMDREDAIRRLTRKHGGTIEAVLACRDKMRAEIDGFERQEERLNELDQEIVALGKVALETATDLSKVRHRSAADFARSVEGELKKLAMDRTAFEVNLSPHHRGENAVEVDGVVLTSSGSETAEFLIAPNAGEAIKPLAKIASGGELSRVMLAIKRVLAGIDPVFTYVFDEVDTGMSGAAADAVGRLLFDVSKERQIVVITHLPQIAAFGTSHFTVSKDVDADGRVRTKIANLDRDGTEREMARMLAGSQITEAAIMNARAMLDACHAP